ncbi:hypothetical protein NUW58_g3422 [Xylaria curta]|uniref:Uncharacterized protein n=1 Tax=Xylaria curta TaxID=42375 RepID=A0ACC1PCR8_9PEZI|nr:hypothetical protein NUW58_g3422 [Xylaria curta]
MALPAKTRRDYEDEVRSWGFSDVFTWTDSPYAGKETRLADRLWLRSNAYYSPHSHNGLTTHLIIDGQLTIIYPSDAAPTKTTYSAGDRIDVEARRVHEVWIGPQGCTMHRRNPYAVPATGDPEAAGADATLCATSTGFEFAVTEPKVT